MNAAETQHRVAIAEVGCVQNAYHPAGRASQLVLEECMRRDIAFVPFGPLGFGANSILRNPVLAQVAARVPCTPAQACLAWELATAPNLLLIPGTSSVQHLHENVAAAEIRLDDAAFRAISAL